MALKSKYLTKRPKVRWSIQWCHNCNQLQKHTVLLRNNTYAKDQKVRLSCNVCGK